MQCKRINRKVTKNRPIRKSFLFLLILICFFGFVSCSSLKAPASKASQINKWLIEYEAEVRTNKALVIADDPAGKATGARSWNAPNIEDAIKIAFEECEKSKLLYSVRSPCRLYYKNDEFVFNQTPERYRPEPTRKEPAPSVEVPKRLTSYGTGFFVGEDGTLLTAFHVIQNATNIIVHLSDGTRRSARVIKHSKIIDIAVLQAEGIPPEFLRPSPYGVASPGDYVFTFGYPAIDLLGNEPKFTDGAISSLSGPGGEAAFLQISVPVQPGNSGGPLVNQSGQVVGIVTASAAILPFVKATGSLPQNVNWATNVDFIKPLLPKWAADASKVHKKKTAVKNVRKSVCLVEANK